MRTSPSTEPGNLDTKPDAARGGGLWRTHAASQAALSSAPFLQESAQQCVCIVQNECLDGLSVWSFCISLSTCPGPSNGRGISTDATWFRTITPCLCSIWLSAGGGASPPQASASGKQRRWVAAACGTPPPRGGSRQTGAAPPTQRCKHGCERSVRVCVCDFPTLPYIANQLFLTLF